MGIPDWEPLLDEFVKPGEKADDEIGKDSTLYKSLVDMSTEINNLRRITDEQREQIQKQKTNFDEQTEELKKQNEEISDQKEEIETIKNDLNNQKNRIPEIVGLFSAIIALVLIDVSVIKTASTFLGAILLIVSLTCSISIFAVLIHSFFSAEDRIRFGKLFWIPICFLSALILIGVWAFFNRIDLYQIVPEEQRTNQAQENKIILPEK